MKFTFAMDMFDVIVSDATCTTCGEGAVLFDGAGALPVIDTTTMTWNYNADRFAQGYYVTDKICLDSAFTACATAFEFFLATSQTDLYYGSQGLIGLAPFVDDTQYAKLLISELKKANAITNAVFCLLVTDAGLTLDVGQIIVASMDNAEDLQFIDNTSSGGYWASEITQLRTRDADGNTSAHYAFDAIEAKVTPDVGCIGLPASMMNQVNGLLLAGLSDDFWYADAARILVEEADLVQLPTLEFLLGGYWVQVLPTDYMVAYGPTTKRAACIFETDDDNILLGTGFLNGYYSVFSVGDADNAARMGFAPVKDGTKLAMADYNPASADEPLPTSQGSALEDKACFEDPSNCGDGADGGDGAAEDSAYYLNSALVISSLMTLALF